MGITTLVNLVSFSNLRDLLVTRKIAQNKTNMNKAFNFTFHSPETINY
ncbi:hypothetical protein OENI_60135 [Oenococcus oeni]|nr:hypothetical protein OENI_60135 [Oenococcus oeni]SYW17805.1 hypothetical protein OENI_120015 [Oenococcus oeni]